MAAVRHTRHGKVYSEEYALKAGKKKAKGKTNKEAMANQTPLTDAMRAKHVKRKLSGSETKSDVEENNDTKECREHLKCMHENLGTVTELYKGSKARLTIAEQALKNEKKLTEEKVKSCEERHASMWSDRTKKYINSFKERLAAFNKTDME